MPAPTVYQSTDASAPVLDGQSGSLLAVLDACLVNGYGIKSGAGWTKPFANSANIGCYRAGSGLQYPISINDASVNATALGREAQARGYESLSSVSTGTSPYPTVAQMAASGVPIRKSRTNDATARKWIVVADDRTFYLFTFPDDFAGYSGFMFGEFYSFLPSNPGRSIIIGRNVVADSTAVIDNLNDLHALQIAAATSLGHWAARNSTQLPGTPGIVGKHGNGAHNATQLFGRSGVPSPLSGGILLSRVFLHEVSSASALESVNIRGFLRGFWHFLHPIGSQVNDGDTFSGTGDLAGRNFLVIRPVADGQGVYIIETTQWELGS